MTDFFAALQFRVDSQETDVASKRLDTVSEKAGRAQRATDSLGAAASKMSGSLLAAVQAIQKQVGELVELARLQQAAAGGAHALAAANDHAAAATMRFSTSFTPLQTGAARAAAATRDMGVAAQATAQDMRQAAASMQMADAHVRAFQAQALAIPKAHNAATVSSKALTQATLNLSRQFADVGVSAAMGMSPLMIMVQQGPQIADAFAMAKAQGLGFQAVLRGMGAAAAPILVALAPIALAVGAVTAAFALFEREVDKNTKHATTWGDTWKATVSVIGDAIMDGPIGDALRWLHETFGMVLDAIVKGAMAYLDRFVGFWGAAFETIIKHWRQFPQALGAIMVGAINGAIRNVEGFINATIDGLNRLTSLAGWEPLAHVKLGEIKQANNAVAADFEKTRLRIESSFRAGREEFFDKIVSRSDKLAAAREKAAKSGKNAADGAKAHADKLKDEENALLKAAEAAQQYYDNVSKTLRDATMTPEQKLDFESRPHILAAEAAGWRDLADAIRLYVSVEKARLAIQRQANDPTFVSSEDQAKDFEDRFGADLAAKKTLDKMKADAQRMSDAFNKVRGTLEEVRWAFERGDWGAVVSSLLDVIEDLKKAFSSAGDSMSRIGALAGAASFVGDLIGGKAGKALKGAASGAMAGAQLGSLIPGVGNVIGAVVGGIVGGVTSLLKGKPSNHGALATLTDTGFSLAGNKRNAETSEGATQIARAFLQGQQLLRDAGITASASVRSVDFGSRDKTDIVLSDGRTLKTAVGDAGAAAEAGLKAILEGAKFVNSTQQKLVEDMQKAGASFDEISTALIAWKDKMTAAQGLGQSIADQILKYTDPRGYDVAMLQRSQEARAKELADYLAGEFIDQSTFDQLSAQLNQLNELELADTLKKYNQAAMDAANDVAAAARETIGNWLDIADSLADYRKSLAAQAAGAASPLAAYRQAKGAFDALAPGVRAGDVSALQSIQSVGDAYIAAARAVAPDAVTVARAIAQVQGLAGEGEAFARSQSGDVYREIADNTAQLVAQIGALTTQLIAAQQTIIEQNKTIAEQTAKAANVLSRATQGGDSFVVTQDEAA